MANGLTVFVAVVLLGVFKTGESSAVRIQIQPNKYNELVAEDGVHISCKPDIVSDGEYEIVALEILNDKRYPITMLRCGKDIKYYDNVTSSDIQVEGQIAKNSDQSFINLTLLNPVDQDGGYYRCVMYYMDGTGKINEEEASEELRILKDFDMLTLEKLLKKTMRKTAHLEHSLKDMVVKYSEAKDRIRILEGKTRTMSQNISALERNTQTQRHDVLYLQEGFRNQSQKISSLANKDSKTIERLVILEGKAINTSHDLDALEDIKQEQGERINSLEESVRMQSQSITILANDLTNTTAFFARAAGANLKLSVGKSVVFPDVLMNVGEAYDPRSGIFTAPRAGLYAFHMTILTSCSGCQSDISLQANGKIIGISSARDYQTLDQSSISIVVQLNSGDTVRSMVRFVRSDVNKSSVPSAHGSNYSMFSGYLIAPL